MKRLLPALLSGLFLLTFFTDLAAQTPRTRAYLWTRYETGDKPTQTDYRDVFASFFSKVEDSLYISQLRGVDTLLTDATLTGATNRQIPTAAAVKTYVDNAISGGVGAVTSVFGRTGGITAGAGDYTASQITNTPAGDIAATTVQAALNELDSEKLQDTTGSVDADNIATGAVGADELASSGVTLGTYGSDTQIPVITVDADGRITSASNVAAAGGGGGVADGDKTDIDVSSSGTVWTIDTSAVTTIKIASDAVTGAKIAASTIDSTDIATGGIGNTDLAAGIVTNGKIAAGAVGWTETSTALRDSIGRVHTVTLLQDSILVVKERNGTELSRDTIAGTGSSGTTIILENYDSLLTYTGSATTALVKDFESTSGWRVKGGFFYRVSLFGGLTFGQTADYGTRFTDGLSRKWQRQFNEIDWYPEFFRVDSTKAMAGTAGYYRCGGDAINQCASSNYNNYQWRGSGDTTTSQAGQVIHLTAGKIYKSEKQITLYGKTTLRGNGAWIVRADPHWTIVQDTILVGQTFAIVPGGATAQMTTGMAVGVGRRGDTNTGRGELETIHSGYQSTIASFGRVNPVNNDTIYFGAATKTGRSGDTLYVGMHDIIYLYGGQPGEHHVEGVNFDGNSSQNRFTRSWLAGNTIHTSPYGKNRAIEQCHFQNIPNENITGTVNYIKNCTARNLQGSFYHHSSLDTVSVVINGCKIDRVCQTPQNINGHNEGTFNASAFTRNIFVSDCNVSRGIGILGQMTSEDANWTLDNVTADSFRYILYSGGEVKFLKVRNSSFYDCGDFVSSGLLTGSLSRGFVEFHNNWFVNSRFSFSGYNPLIFTNNTLSWTTAKWAGYTSDISGANSNNAAFVLSDNSNVQFTGNIIYGDTSVNARIANAFVFAPSGTNTITLEDGSTTTTYNAQNVDVSNNKIYNFERFNLLTITDPNRVTNWTWKNNVFYNKRNKSLYGFAWPTAPLRPLVVTFPGSVFDNNLIYNQADTTVCGILIGGIKVSSSDTSAFLGSVVTNNRFLGKRNGFVSSYGNCYMNSYIVGNTWTDGSSSFALTPTIFSYSYLIADNKLLNYTHRITDPEGIPMGLRPPNEYVKNRVISIPALYAASSNLISNSK